MISNALVAVPRPWVVMFDFDEDDFEYLKNLKKAAEIVEVPEAADCLRRQQGDRYWDHRANMVMSAAVRAVKYQKQLTNQQVKCFVTALDKKIGWLTAAFETQLKIQSTLSSELSDSISLKKNWLQTFKIRGRKQAMMGQKTVETEECDASCAW